MTIDEVGFLSPEISNWITKHRTANKDWFQLSGDLNRLAQRAISLITAPSENKQILTAALLFIRGVASFQATILLAERGMTQDARISVRSCFETVFYLGALLKDPGVVEALIRDDADHRGKLARALLNLPEGSGLEAEHTARLNRFLNDLKQSGTAPESIRVFETAKLAGLDDIYNTYYRGLSNDAAHPSVTSLNRYLASDRAGMVTGLHWGPDVLDVEDTINNACTAMIYLLTYIGDILGIQEAFGKDLKRCWAKYKKLIKLTEERQRKN
jgi:hypothetical protein